MWYIIGMKINNDNGSHGLTDSPAGFRSGNFNFLPKYHRVFVQNMNFETAIRSLQQDLEDLKDEYETVIHQGRSNSVYLENDLLEQIDELQDNLDQLTT